ncbi:single-stranded DNA-binding protein [Klebsiella michiganensis]|nr:single-stranded DNA-binding protein [Raoultella planticola]AUV96011.1 single-stranded DNA-binding protein [Klebsiella oxytoca]MBE0111650.1 single-stranded DNA-binding protein [Klebsiella michiganensis]RWS96219.1 single-stranded DNA-binding protein [Raoultella ornithinolytica]MBE0014162.1 single-stranded DNA-binding protein [Raoultella planticola]
MHRAVLVDALAAKVLKRVKVIPPGTKQQVPANVKTAASGNSTDDGVLKAKQRSKESHHGSTRHQ